MFEKPANDQDADEAEARRVEKIIDLLEKAIAECRNYIAELRKSKPSD